MSLAFFGFQKNISWWKPQPGGFVIRTMSTALQRLWAFELGLDRPSDK